MTRPTRLHKTHADDAVQLDLAAELRALLVAYDDCPGIVGDLLALLADLERRQAAQGRASCQY